MVRHSHQDALSETEFQRLVDATEELKHPFDAEALFILVAAGRLGMRAGEIAHMRRDWINYDDSLIQIPRHDPCRDGEDGGPCSYCETQAALAVEHADELTFEDAIDQRWEPKTTTSVRAIPFDFDDFVEAVVLEFFETRDAFPRSRVTINRRVNRALEAAEMPEDKCYPHSLRATAASHHAYKGVPSAALQDLFGWAQLSTAQKYLRLSGGATANALRDVHGD